MNMNFLRQVETCCFERLAKESMKIDNIFADKVVNFRGDRSAIFNFQFVRTIRMSNLYSQQTSNQTYQYPGESGISKPNRSGTRGVPRTELVRKIVLSDNLQLRLKSTELLINLQKITAFNFYKEMPCFKGVAPERAQINVCGDIRAAFATIAILIRFTTFGHVPRTKRSEENGLQ